MGRCSDLLASSVGRTIVEYLIFILLQNSSFHPSRFSRSINYRIFKSLLLVLLVPFYFPLRRSNNYRIFDLDPALVSRGLSRGAGRAGCVRGRARRWRDRWFRPTVEPHPIKISTLHPRSGRSCEDVQMENGMWWIGRASFS
jgi:hypothetical protein